MKGLNAESDESWTDYIYFQYSHNCLNQWFLYAKNYGFFKTRLKYFEESTVRSVYSGG